MGGCLLGCEEIRNEITDLMYDEIDEDLEELYEDYERAEQEGRDADKARIEQQIRDAVERIGRRFGGTVWRRYVAGWFIRAAFDFGRGLGGFVATAFEEMADSVIARNTNEAIANICAGDDTDFPALGPFRTKLLVVCYVDGPQTVSFNVEFLRRGGGLSPVNVHGEGSGLFFTFWESGGILSVSDVLTRRRFYDAQFRVRDGFRIVDSPPCPEGQTFSMTPSDPEICFAEECYSAGHSDRNAVIIYVAYIKIETACLSEDETGVGGEVDTGPTTVELLDSIMKLLRAIEDVLARKRRQLRELQERDDPEAREEAARLLEEIRELEEKATEIESDDD